MARSCPSLSGARSLPPTSFERPMPTDHGEDAVSVLERVREPLQDEDAGPLADDEPVPRPVERRAAAPRRESAELREAHLRVERVGPRGTAREHAVGAAREELVAGERDRVER